MAALPLPFPDPAPPLSTTEQSLLLREAEDAYQQLFTAVRIARNGADGTHLGGVSGATTGTVMMCSTVRIAGTIEELAELYVAPDNRFILDFAQSHRVYELETPSPHHPLRCTAVRWSRWGSISKLVTDRDILYLEVMDEFLDKKTGHRGWARCTKSIVHRSCPPSHHPNGPIRAELFVSGQIVRETSKFGELELITLVHADVKHSMPSWITRAVLKSRKKKTQGLSHVLKVRRRVREHGGSGSGSSQHGTDDSETSRGRVCKGCEDAISRWTRSFKCRKCHEMICKSCAAMKYVDTDTQTIKNRICSDCTFAMYDEEDNASSGGDTTSQRGIRALKNEGGEGGTRARTYSHLSADSDSVASNGTPERLPDAADLSSTMRRLSLLNTNHGTGPDMSNGGRAGRREAEPTITRRRDEQRTLHTLYSMDSVTRPTRDEQRSQTRKLERAASHDGMRADHKPQSSTGSISRPVTSQHQRQHSRRSPASARTTSARPQAPPPVLDLGYLQDFATAKSKS